MSHFSIGYCPEEEDKGHLIQMVIKPTEVIRAGINPKSVAEVLSNYFNTYLLMAQPITAPLAKALTR